MMVLENACEFEEYLGSMFDEMGFYGSSEVVGNNIDLNIIHKDNNDLPNKEQVLEKLKEIALKKKKIINAQCGLDKNIEKGFIYIKPRFF
ncbi:hypothetical protein HpHUE47_14460 [Helicobacter pylori]